MFGFDNTMYVDDVIDVFLCIMHDVTVVTLTK